MAVCRHIKRLLLQAYNKECVVRDDGDLMSVIDEDQLNSKDLLFLPNETKAFHFCLHASVQEMGKSLRVRSSFASSKLEFHFGHAVVSLWVRTWWNCYGYVQSCMQLLIQLWVRRSSVDVVKAEQLEWPLDAVTLFQIL